MRRGMELFSGIFFFWSSHSKQFENRRKNRELIIQEGSKGSYLCKFTTAITAYLLSREKSDGENSDMS